MNSLLRDSVVGYITDRLDQDQLGELMQHILDHSWRRVSKNEINLSIEFDGEPLLVAKKRPDGKFSYLFGVLDFHNQKIMDESFYYYPLTTFDYTKVVEYPEDKE